MFFFGCRKRSKDFLYEAEWKSFLEDKTLTHFIVAFSRFVLGNQFVDLSF
jgi:sulfite reductase alpha subunit-like flavoprotein